MSNFSYRQCGTTGCELLNPDGMKEVADDSSSQASFQEGTIMRLFHLTPTTNKVAIQVEGIRANGEGKIFAFTDMRVANTIARDQIFTPQFSVFRINPKGIQGKIIYDRVAEIAAHWHRVILQVKILPRHLTLVGDFVTQRGPTEWDYAKCRCLGLPDSLIEMMFDGSLAEKLNECANLPTDASQTD